MPSSIRCVSSTQPHRVLVVGASYAGISAVIHLLELAAGHPHRPSSVKLPDIPLQKLKNGLEITLVDERDGFFHTIGNPLALASSTFAQKCWMTLSTIPALQHPSITLLHGSVTNVNPFTKIASYTLSTGIQTTGSISYDYLIAASGLRRSFPTIPRSPTKTTYLKDSLQHIHTVSNASEGVIVIGGGAVGIEMAGEIKIVFPDLKVTLVHSRAELLSSEPLPGEFKAETLRLLKELGINVMLSSRVTKVTEHKDGSKTVDLNGKSGLVAGKVIWALSKQVPSSTYLPAEALDEEGLVEVRASMQFPTIVPNSSTHFAPGDIASWTGIKRCGAAIMMGHLTAVNVHQLILRSSSESLHHSKSVDSSPVQATSPNVTSIDEIAYAQFPPVPSMIALAVGTKAVTYSESDGVSSSEELMKAFFGDDLGWSIIWQYMRLGEKVVDPVAEVPELEIEIKKLGTRGEESIVEEKPVVGEEIVV